MTDQIHEQPERHYIPASSQRIDRDPLTGAPSLRTTYNLPAGIVHDAQEAMHYVDERAVMRPLSTRRWYSVAIRPDGAYDLTCWSTLTSVETYKMLEAAHADALAEDDQRAAQIDRTYETTSAALELSNTEALYTAARRLISRRLAQTDPDTENRTPAQVAADALKEYVEGIMDEQDTRNPHTALLVALANAATCRVDWEDLAHEIAAEIL